MSKYLTQLYLFLNHPHKIVNGYIGGFELLVVVLLKKMSFSHIRHIFVTYSQIKYLCHKEILCSCDPK